MIDINFFLTVVSPIIILACLIIGYILKNAIPNQTINRFIPLILAGCGIIFNVWYMGTFNFDIFLAGAASGLAATGTYEAFKNLIEHFGKDDEEIIIPKGEHLKK